MVRTLGRNPAVGVEAVAALEKWPSISGSDSVPAAG